MSCAGYREGRMHEATFERGRLQEDHYEDTHEEDGTYVYFEPDPELFLHFRFEDETVDTMLRNYTYLNTGLAIFLNGRRIISRNGLEDLLNDNMTAPGTLSDYPSERRQYRYSLYAYFAIWRRVLLFCQRAAYDLRRHASERL